MVLQDENNKYCIKCNKICTNEDYGWCKQCEINFLKNNFINWTSENNEIDNFIQEMQLKINSSSDIIFEWIPYNKFIYIKEIDKNNIFTIYLAEWKDGSLYWSSFYKKYIRKRRPDKVTLKYLHNLQSTDEFLNEV